MRVALVYTSYNHPTQPYLKRTAEELAASGVELKVFSRLAPKNGLTGASVLQGGSGWRGGARAMTGAIGAPRSFMRWVGCLGAGDVRRGVRRWLDLEELISGKFGLIHLQNASLYLLLREYLEEAKMPFVVSFRGHDTVVRPEQDEEWRNALREVYGRASALHFVSEYLQKEGIRRGAPEERCVVIRQGVDPDWWARGAVKRGSSVVLTSAGRLVWEKAFELAFLVVKRLVGSGIDVEYHVVGDGPAKWELVRWARELGIGDRLRWHGLLDQERLREVLNRTDVYFQPSVSDSLPVAILEAMAMELPVVATRVGGIAEAVTGGETGILADFGDVDALAEGIMKLAGNDRLRMSMGKAGRERVVREFCISREVQEWTALYQRLARRD